MDEIIEENVAKQTAYLLGEQSGIQQGIEQGSLETKKELVINMYNNKIALEMISKCTSFTIEEIKRIIKEIN